MRPFTLTGSVLTAAALIVAACGGDTTTDPTTPGTTASTPTPSATSSPSPSTPSGAGAAAYFIIDAGEYGGPFLVPVWAAGIATPADALEALLTGPQAVLAGTGFSAAGLSTAVPEGTQLLDVSVAGGTATVDLSGDYGDGGGSASMFARLAQVVYTATQFDDVTEVELLMDGTPVEVFSSEGLVIDGPQTREDSLESGVVGKLFVDRPAYGQPVGSTFALTGLARDPFEATFVFEVVADGTALANGPVTAMGSQGWNDYEHVVTVSAQQQTPASLMVSEYSAQDGSTVFELTYEIVVDPDLTPGG